MRYAVLALLALAAAPSAAQDRAKLPEFLAGSWKQQAGGKQTLETWNASPERMFGTSQETEGSKVLSRETMVIDRAGDTLVFLAQPQDAQAVPFALVSQDATWIEFANPQHDYPQRIRYWREGRQLNAMISRMDGSDAVSWSYAPESG